MSDHDLPPRPGTPQVLLHRLPDRPLDPEETVRQPSKYVVVIEASTAVAGKVQIAGSVARSLSCSLYLGDAVHESSAKAANVGSTRLAPEGTAIPTTSDASDTTGQASSTPTSGPNKARYQRMWLSKLTRTGLLFPEESRPATEGFSGFSGSVSPSASRRSASSVGSVVSSHGSADSSSPVQSTKNTLPYSPSSSSINTVFTISEKERLRRANPVLMVLTHPELELWHRSAIRSTVGEYGIGIIFVPLYEEDIEDIHRVNTAEEDSPVLQPLDPSTMTAFPSSTGWTRETGKIGCLDRELKVDIDTHADVEGIIAQIIQGVRGIIGN